MSQYWIMQEFFCDHTVDGLVSLGRSPIKMPKVFIGGSTEKFTDLVIQKKIIEPLYSKMNMVELDYSDKPEGFLDDFISYLKK